MSDSTFLGLDIEACSAARIDNGSAAYAAHPSTRVHCAVLSLVVNRRTEKTFNWLPGLRLPTWAVCTIEAGEPVLAHNVSFEACMVEHLLAPAHGWPKPRRWLDSLAVAASHNLPAGLAALGKALGVAAQKDDEGNKLMKKLAKVRVGADGQFVYPEVTQEQLDRLVDYCARDVASMIECWLRLPRQTPVERRILQIDRRINARGALLDLPLAAAIKHMAKAREAQIGDDVWTHTQELLGVTSVPALKAWLGAKGVDLPNARRKKADGTFHMTASLDRASLDKIVLRDDLPEDVLTVLRARQETGRVTSIAKVARAPLMVSADNRLRFALRYCGAHTGRWSSKGLQLHNLAKASKEFRGVADQFAAAVRARDLKAAAALWPVLEGLSFLLRSLVIAGPGKEIFGGDFAAIEARGIAWLSGQHNVLAAFADPKRDVYTEDARAVGSEDRQFGKVQRLGLGYGMGVVTAYGHFLKNRVDISLLRTREVVYGWRENNPKIVNFWHNLEEAFRTVVRRPGEVIVVGKVLVTGDAQCLSIVLPSGRHVRYWRPHVRAVTKKVETVNKDGVIVVKEREQQELRFFKPGKQGMAVEKTYGGKLCENVTQALCRELLGEALLRLEDAGFPVVLHVHDSIASEIDVNSRQLEDFCAVMAGVPAWADGFPVAVEGYRSRHFKG